MHNVYVYPDLHPGKGASMTSKYCLDTAGQVLGKNIVAWLISYKI